MKTIFLFLLLSPMLSMAETKITSTEISTTTTISFPQTGATGVQISSLAVTALQVTGSASFSTQLSSTSWRDVPGFTITATGAGTCITGSTNTLTMAQSRDVMVNYNGHFTAGQVGNTITMAILTNGVASYTWSADGKINGIRDSMPMNTVLRGVSAGTNSFCIMVYKNGGTFTMAQQPFSVTALP